MATDLTTADPMQRGPRIREAGKKYDIILGHPGRSSSKYCQDEVSGCSVRLRTTLEPKESLCPRVAYIKGIK